MIQPEQAYMEAAQYENAYRTRIDQIERALERMMPESDEPYRAVLEAMRYSLLGSGKRIRGILALEFCVLCGGVAEDALPFACALEMVHAYSLIHDDLPCMDNDELRRGKPSCWKAYGETLALLAGDGLLTRAFAAVSSSVMPATQVQEAVAVLAVCAGEAGMLGGQVIDLQSEGKPVGEEQLLQMYRLKTGALLRAAAELGCIAAGAPDQLRRSARAYAEKIGLAFQIVDDILDVAGMEEVLGKPIGSDQASGKTTYVTIRGVEQARAVTRQLTCEALENLEEFTGDQTFLSELTVRLASRQY